LQRGVSGHNGNLPVRSTDVIKWPTVQTNVKFKIIKIRPGCHYICTYTTRKTSGPYKTYDWAAYGPRFGHSWTGAFFSAALPVFSFCV